MAITKPIYTTALRGPRLFNLGRSWIATPSALDAQLPHLRRIDGIKSYTTQSRKQITVVNDDGSVSWKSLTTGEKVARTAQQTGNATIIAAGVAGLIIVIYLMKDEVFGSNSKTRRFNQVVNRIRADPKALELLGSRTTIKAYGEPTTNKRPFARPIASDVSKDSTGIEHFRMHFNVEGSERKGVVQLHMVKGPGQSDFEYRFLALDVPGFPRYYLENASTDTGTKKKAAGLRMLGVQWR
ncbi:uncharacterized protein KY384_003328 [Bacidia gigantensis]|uniref:uncharacterized protein n=1 Tax=Bacidia gigantensis TaxID=2732470 RepID=UPI001D05824E|nr:uncharacterized protein KY384_003328 [Bacidia gigantensis]KAG8531696.1 hypothetical protein KY384_003328 [Bacidia gigantensis]